MLHRSSLLPPPRRVLRAARAASAALLALAALTSAAPSLADGVVPPPVEIPAKLSLDDALTTFRARGFQLLIADAAVMSSEGDEKIAGAVPNPGLNLGYGRVFGSYQPIQSMCPGCDPNTYSVGLSDNAGIEDSLSGKRGLRLKVAHAALAAAKMSRQDAQRNLEFQVKSAYVQVVLAQDSLDFAKEAQNTNKMELDLFQRRYDRGAINEGDLARMKTQKLEADQAVDSANQTLRQARIALAFLLGVRGRVPDFDIDREVLKYRIPSTLQTSSPDNLLRSAFDKRPDLRALGYQRQSAEAQIHLNKRQVFPDISLSVQYTQTGTGPDAIQPPSLSVGLSAPIPVFYQMQGDIRKAEANYNTQSLTQAQTTAQVVNDVENAYAAFAGSKLLVERMEGTELQQARVARDITKRQFEGGTATLMDFLDAQRIYIATNIEYLQDLTNYWTAVYQLEQAVGSDLRK
ncbi:MAG: TolC family protein [Polyangiaceae bacterium]|jgi:outer membrane protein, heavy metal efflux system